MNRFSQSMISMAALAIFCVTLTYWVIRLGTPMPLPQAAAPMRAPASVDDAARLFGDDQRDTRIRLSGILSLGAGRGAAAIVSLDGAPSKAVGIGATIDRNVTLSEVRARSIIVDRAGVRSEVTMSPPAAGSGGVIYMH